MGLATSPAERKDRYDVIVIGSGYGASAVAARVAEKTKDTAKTICILERGREIATRDFPNTGAAVLKDAQFTDGVGTQGDKTGLFDFHLNTAVDVLVGCGLGGTSLINGGISIKPEARVLDTWPPELKNGALDPFYEKAKAVLRPSKFKGPNRPEKLTALENAVARNQALGTFQELEINVHYGDDLGDQKGCNFCGDCVTGCNFFAKNTLPYTYLPIAKQNRAHIFTEMHVDSVEPDPGGGYVVHVTSGETKIDLRARVVVVGAGALGSTKILLRSRRAGFQFSTVLGSGFSTNGDAIAVGYDCTDRTNVIGQGRRLLKSSEPPASVGPTLLGMVDARAGRPLDEAVILEDGAFPSALTDLLLPLMQLLAATARHDTPQSIAAWLKERAREAEDLAGDYKNGALNHSMLYLTMGHDGAAGQMTLDERANVRIDWPALKDAKCFTRSDELAHGVTDALGGMHLRDPLTANPFLKNNITVHPLGGCCIGTDANSGVVDHAGRVFNPAGGTYSGLYVADGSIVPSSLGVNPLFTITALAERIATFVVDEVLGS